MREAWIELKTVVLPWLVAASVVGLVIWLSQREITRLNEALVGQQQELTRIHDLLAQQGYIAPPVSSTTVVAPNTSILAPSMVVAPSSRPTSAAQPRSR